jgi:hypothetical protein
MHCVFTRYRCLHSLVCYLSTRVLVTAATMATSTITKYQQDGEEAKEIAQVTGYVLISIYIIAYLPILLTLVLVTSTSTSLGFPSKVFPDSMTSEAFFTNLLSFRRSSTFLPIVIVKLELMPWLGSMLAGLSWDLPFLWH